MNLYKKYKGNFNTIVQIVNIVIHKKNGDYNMPDMREKVKEYIKELDAEIDRLEGVLTPSNVMSNVDRAMTLSRLDTLLEVKTDLINRLEELI